MSNRTQRNTATNKPTFSTPEFPDSGMGFTSAGKPFLTDGTTTTTFGTDKGGTLAAAGSNQATAAIITKQFTEVTASDGTKGVVLPAATAGGWYAVFNDVSAQNLKIYANGSDTINGTAGATGITQAGLTQAIFTCGVAGKWGATVS